MSIYFDVKTIRALMGDEEYREEREFTLEELSQYNGTNGKSAYVAVEGIVYDVSKEVTWTGGAHFGLKAGKDLTEEFKSCHGKSNILTKLPRVGVLKRNNDIDYIPMERVTIMGEFNLPYNALLEDNDLISMDSFNNDFINTNKSIESHNLVKSNIIIEDHKLIQSDILTEFNNLNNNGGCPFAEGKPNTAKRIENEALAIVENQSSKKMNAIWLEVTGCSGNIISLLNSENPGLYDILTSIVNFTFNNTLMGSEGSFAFKKFLETLDTEFILLVDGAVSTKENGRYNIVANYDGRMITALEAIQMAGEKAKYVIAVGTCASYGGMSAAKPNPSESKSVAEILNRPVIRLPGCPCHPDFVVGTLAHLIGYGLPELDQDGRPILFYGFTIHDTCTRRGLFERGIFAKKFGDEGCMFKIGCRGPVTKNECPRRKWNGYVNWPIGDNTNCIGCAQAQFPDEMGPFVRY